MTAEALATQQRAMTDSEAGETAERPDVSVADAVAAAREDRKRRRHLERERQRASAEQRQRQSSPVYTDLTTINGHAETRSQRAAYKSAHVIMEVGARRIESRMARDGTLRTEVFAFAFGEWTSIGSIDLGAADS
jgi:hypothetical protein